MSKLIGVTNLSPNDWNAQLVEFLKQVEDYPFDTIRKQIHNPLSLLTVFPKYMIEAQLCRIFSDGGFGL